jgi:cation transport ATPase
MRRARVRPARVEAAVKANPSSESSSDRSHRRERRAGRRPRDRYGLGVLLVVVGGLLLLRDSFGVAFQNWWVVFLLIPAAAFLYRAYLAYQASGSVDREVSRQVIPGVVLLLVSVVFLFGLSWNVMGPLLLIFLGLVLFVRREDRDGDA